MITSIRLGLRLARGNDLALRLRSVLAGLAALVCTLVLLGILAAWRTGGVASDRNVAQAPHPDSQGSLLYAAVPDTWHGRSLTRIYLAVDGPNAPVPPGLTRLPQPGQAVVSPALASALRHGDAQLRARFGGMHISTISRTGLTSQTEQLAYIGASAAQLRGAQRVSSFGDAQQITGTVASLKLGALLVFVIFVGVPYAGVCVAATRLGAAARRRRMAALWMIGVRPWQLRLTSATEAGVAVLVGELVAVACYQALRPILAAHVTVDGIRPFAADLQLPILQQLLALACVLLIGVLSGTLLAGSTAWRGMRPARAAHRFRALPLALLAAGVLLTALTAAFVATASAPEIKDWRDPLLDLCAVALVIGAALSMALAMQRLGGGLARRIPPGSTLLAARRLETDPGAITRIAALVLVGTFAVGFAATIATQFNLSNAPAQAEATLGGRQTGTVTSAATSGTLSLTGIQAAVVIPHLQATTADGTPIDVVVANCAQLTGLTGQRVTCPAQPFVLHAVDPQVGSAPIGRMPGATAPGTPIKVRASGGITVSTTYPSATLRVPLSWGSGLAAATVVIPARTPLASRLNAAPVTEATVGVAAHDPAAADTLRASVAAHDPLAEVDLAGANQLAANAGYARYGATTLLLAAIACAIGVIGVAITALDTVLTRARQLEPLLVLGIPRNALRRASLLEIATPLSVATIVGAGIALACSALYTEGQHAIAHTSISALALTTIAGLAVAGIIATLACTMIPPTPTRVAARAE